MQYASDSFDTRTLQLAEALKISPEEVNQEWEQYMTFAEWERQQKESGAAPTTQVAPYVAEYLADCFVPLDPGLDYGLAVTQTVGSKFQFKLEGYTSSDSE
jgi:hypothetical protein